MSGSVYGENADKPQRKLTFTSFRITYQKVGSPRHYELNRKCLFIRFSATVKFIMLRLLLDTTTPTQ